MIVRRREWAGHLLRTSDGRTVTKAGRTKLRYSDCTENDIKSMGVKRWRKKEDRSAWAITLTESPVKLWGPYTNEGVTSLPELDTINLTSPFKLKTEHLSTSKCLCSRFFAGSGYVKIVKSSVEPTGGTGRQLRLTVTNVRGEDGPRTTCCS